MWKGVEKSFQADSGSFHFFTLLFFRFHCDPGGVSRRHAMMRACEREQHASSKTESGKVRAGLAKAGVCRLRALRS
jgi:hypothetical protein